MPLRDHVHSPLDDLMSWDGVHGQWPAMIVLDLVKTLPLQFVAMPRVSHGAMVEFDVAAFEHDPGRLRAVPDTSGGTTVAVEAPIYSTEIDLNGLDEYEVRIYDTREGRKLVAVIEIVSPGNKDRLDKRRAFMAKCATRIRQGVTLAIVDIVTSRHANLFRDLMDFLGRSPPEAIDGPIYAVVLSVRETVDHKQKLEVWGESLKLGRPLPTLPLRLTDEIQVRVALEASYEATCTTLRIP